MKSGLTLFAGLLTAGVIGTSAMGDAHASKAVEAAVKARQAQMTLYAFNLGLLGGMAKGAIEYDAAAASAAAANLAAQASMDQSRMWLPGSDADAFGDGTRAKPDIWKEGSKAGEYGMALAKNAAALSSAAGDGLEALRGAIGPVGKTCGGCHDDYRVPKN